MEEFDRDKYFQGKSKENYENSSEIVFWCLVILSVIGIGYFFVNLIAPLLLSKLLFNQTPSDVNVNNEPFSTRDM